MRDAKDPKGGTLDKMLDSRAKELIEPISSRKTRHQVRDGDAIPQFETLTQNRSCLKELEGQNEGKPEGKKVQ